MTFWWPTSALRGRRALSLAPKDADSYAALGYYHYWGHRDYTKALSAFQQALALSPAHNRALRGIALVSRRLGRWDAAVEAYRRAIADNPRDARICQELGETLFLMRRYPEALSELDKALSIDPTDYLSWAYRGNIRLALTGDFAAARAEFARAPDETRHRSSSNFQTTVGGPVGVRLLSPESEDTLLRVPMGPLDADSATYYLVRGTGYQYLGRPAGTASGRLGTHACADAADGGSAAGSQAMAAAGRAGPPVRRGCG